MAGRRYRRVREAGKDFPHFLVDLFHIGTGLNGFETKHLRALWRRYGDRINERLGEPALFGPEFDGPPPSDEDVTEALRVVGAAFPVR